MPAARQRATMSLDPQDPETPPEAVVAMTGEGARSDVIVVCEHAANRLPPWTGGLGLAAEARGAHVAWDPGALGVAQGLARHLDATLVAAQVSRLVFDLNRPPDSAGAMAARSEVHDIPGNAGLTAAERLRRTEAVYLPFHTALHGLVARRLAVGRPPVIVTVHSFTPVWFGTPRTTELGVIHDACDRLARIVAAEAAAQTGLRVALNDPYSAADGVTHLLRLHATPYGLPNVMLEIRNDLIATPFAEAAMADLLAPVLTTALAQLPVAVEA
jgi:predicted N-formylglutamate amidohydrolase